MKIEDCKVGDLIRIIANSNHHNYTIGEVYKILQIFPWKTFRAISTNGVRGNYLQAGDVVKVCSKKIEQYAF